MMHFGVYTLTIPNPAEKIKGDEAMYKHTDTHGMFGTLPMQAALNLYLPPEDAACGALHPPHALRPDADGRRRRTVFPKRCRIHFLR